MSVKNAILNSIAVKQRLLGDSAILEQIENIIHACIGCLQNDGKILFCGNGGSASDAQHLAAELTGKYYFDRAPLNAEALNVNSSYLTAVSNDYSFEKVYARILEAKGRKGDVLIALSTSGKSGNVIEALKKARELGIITVGLTGESGGSITDLCDYLIKVPSADTPRIQETHILIGHLICEHIEDKIFKND